MPQGQRLVGREVVELDTVDSTSSEVKRRAAAGAAEGLAVLAREQTGGRGRRGNSFQSPRDQGLYCSVLLRPRLTLAQLSQLTAWTAVAVCRAVRACAGAECGIKWTNDLVLNGRKLCGILTELELDPVTRLPAAVVVGVGINLTQTHRDFGPALSPIATSLAQEGFPADRDAMAGALLDALDQMYAGFPAQHDRYLEAYRALCVTLGREVVLVGPDGAGTPAFAEAVEEDFSLAVRLPGGTRRTVTAGEVSVRGLMGYVDPAPDPEIERSVTL